MSKPPAADDVERRSLRTRVEGYSCDALMKHLLIELEENGAFVEEGGEGWLCRAPQGDALLCAGGAAAAITLVSDTPERLEALRASVERLIAELSPDLAAGLVWTAANAGSSAPEA